MPAKAFHKIAHLTTRAAGSPAASITAFGFVAGWVLGGLIRRNGFDEPWQMVINTSTTIVTFLMVFLIQATTNREGRATQVKIDELIRAMKGAKNQLIGLEEDDDEKIEAVQRELKQHREARE